MVGLLLIVQSKSLYNQMVSTIIKSLVVAFAIINVVGIVNGMAPYGRGPLRRGYIVEQLPTDELPDSLADPLFLTPYLEVC
jgi:hypothetical protein